jgi:hypothetical protein
MIEAKEHLDRKIYEVAEDIQNMLGKEGYKRLYHAFWKRYIDCQILDSFHKIPEMILLMRKTDDVYLFAMIVCFLSLDYSFAHTSLNYALHEWQPRNDED